MEGHELYKGPEFMEFLEKLRGLVIEYQEFIEPKEMCDCHPMPDGSLLLDRVMLITTWLDEDGDEWIARANDNMPFSNVQGILHRMLFD